MGIGDGDGSFEKSGFFHPGGAGHFTVSVLRVPAGVDGLAICTASGEDYRDSGANRTLADD